MYMYKMLSKAIFDVEDRTKIKSNWSPNSIKNIIILRDSIIVVYHTTKPSKIISLTDEAILDFQSNGNKGSLHNVLSAYQLSCLEEIYIDSSFINYTGTLNLVKYITSLVNTKSRLRYYGYIQWSQNITNEIYNFYENGKMRILEDYTLAIDGPKVVSGLIISTYSTDNLDWFEKYNLRPDKYKTDSEDGSLALWFNKVCNELKVQQDSLMREATEKYISLFYTRLLKNELNRLSTIKLWYNVIKELNKGKCNPFGKSLLGVIKSTENNYSGSSNSSVCFKPNCFISREIFTKVSSNINDPRIKYLEGFLNSVGCIDDSKVTDEYLSELIADSKDINTFVNITALKYYIPKLLNSNKNNFLYLWNICVDFLDMPKTEQDILGFLSNYNDFNTSHLVLEVLIYACGFNNQYFNTIKEDI